MKFDSRKEQIHTEVSLANLTCFIYVEETDQKLNCKAIDFRLNYNSLGSLLMQLITGYIFLKREKCFCLK
jgi:hypothetical protein